MSSSSETIFNLGTFQVVVAPGATLSQLISTSSSYGPGAIAMQIKPLAGGGSMYILGFTATNGPFVSGQTLTAAERVSLVASAQFWPLDNPLSIDGAARFYLGALGATTTAAIIIGRTIGV